MVSTAKVPLMSNDDYPGITCLGDATIILSGTNTVKGGGVKAGFQIGGPGSTLTIEGDGSLSAIGGSQSAGIGLSRAWGESVSGGNIIINSGTIVAQSSSLFGAGIGTGVIYGQSNSAILGNITINGGYVTATGSTTGAGIGTGFAYPNTTNRVGNININGGTVVANGGAAQYDGAPGGAGIGTGENNYSNNTNQVGDITISSAVTSVTATRGSANTVSIGAGPRGICGTVTIEDPSKVTQN